MRFADVLGHEAVTDRLRRTLGTRPASAYLLVGPAGVGKRNVADALAARLLCEAPVDDDACGSCRHCVRAAAGTHPDLLLVVRDEDRRDVRVEQVRELLRWLSLRPMMAARKVALIDGAHDLNDAGQSALLKTLEEPPGAATIVLVANGLTRLLPTVRSRCQQLRLDPLPVAIVAAALEDAGHDAAVAATLAARSGGSIGRACELADEDLEALRSRTLTLAAEVGSASAADLSAFAAELGKGPTTSGLEVLVAWYRDLLRCALGTTELGLANVDVQGGLEAAATGLSPEIALRLLEVVCDTVEAIGRNANKTLALETMLLELRGLVRRAERTPWMSPPP